MSETATDTAINADEHAHPSDWEYVKVALVLGLITGVEVSTYFQSVVDWGSALVPSLLIMMVVKFWLVARMFMHLKADGKVLSNFFVAGLAMASGIYIITLNVFRFWGG